MLKIKRIRWRRLAHWSLLVGSVAIVGAVPTAAKLHAQHPARANHGQIPPNLRPSDTDMLVRILHRDFGYRLDEGAVLKHIGPPLSWARTELANMGFRREPQEMLEEGARTGMGFLWNGSALVYQTALKTEAPKMGAQLYFILRLVLGVDETRLGEGQDLAHRTMIAGDWVVRANAPLEKTVPELARIVKVELKLPIQIALEEVERPIYVVSGKYKYKAYDLADADQPIAWREHKDTHEMIHIFGSEIYLRHNEQSYTGPFDQFLAALSQWIHVPIESEVKQPPTRPFCWTGYEHVNPGTSDDRDPELVLARISEQTGLEFKKKLHKLKIVSVRKAP